MYDFFLDTYDFSLDIYDFSLDNRHVRLLLGHLRHLIRQLFNRLIRSRKVDPDVLGVTDRLMFVLEANNESSEVFDIIKPGQSVK